MNNLETESSLLIESKGDKVSTCLTEISANARRHPHQMLGQEFRVFDVKASSHKTILVDQGFNDEETPPLLSFGMEEALETFPSDCL